MLFHTQTCSSGHVMKTDEFWQNLRTRSAVWIFVWPLTSSRCFHTTFMLYVFYFDGCRCVDLRLLTETYVSHMGASRLENDSRLIGSWPLDKQPRVAIPSTTSPVSALGKFTMWIRGEINHLCVHNQTTTCSIEEKMFVTKQSSVCFFSTWLRRMRATK
jgi:hypothetical protein